jgi:hypothetical protein
MGVQNYYLMISDVWLVQLGGLEPPTSCHSQEYRTKVPAWPRLS